MQRLTSYDCQPVSSLQLSYMCRCNRHMFDDALNVVRVYWHSFNTTSSRSSRNRRGDCRSVWKLIQRNGFLYRFKLHQRVACVVPRQHSSASYSSRFHVHFYIPFMWLPASWRWAITNKTFSVRLDTDTKCQKSMTRDWRSHEIKLCTCGI